MGRVKGLSPVAPTHAYPDINLSITDKRIIRVNDLVEVKKGRYGWAVLTMGGSKESIRLGIEEFERLADILQDYRTDDLEEIKTWIKIEWNRIQVKNLNAILVIDSQKEDVPRYDRGIVYAYPENIDMT